MNHQIRTGILLACALALPACGGGGGSNDGMSAQTGQLSLAIGDAPVDGATEVVVVFTGIELHSNGGTRSIDFAAPREIDLLAYQNGATVNLLENLIVDAGEYQWMRLKVIAERNRSDGSYILFESGEQFPLLRPQRFRDRAQDQPAIPGRGGRHHAPGGRLRPAQVHHRAAGPGAQLHAEAGPSADGRRWRSATSMEASICQRWRRRSWARPRRLRTATEASISSAGRQRRPMTPTEMRPMAQTRLSTSHWRSTACRRSCRTSSRWSRRPLTRSRQPVILASMRRPRRASTTRAQRPASLDSRRCTGRLLATSWLRRTARRPSTCPRA